MRPPKYRNQPQETPDGRFASKREYQHWCVLKLREKAGEISSLKRQVPFDIKVNGVKICRYVADAVYVERNRVVVADAKGFETPMFKIKSKLMKAVHDIDVTTC